MNEYEVDEAPEESGSDPEPEETPRDPEPEESPSEPAPDPDPEPEVPEEPAPEPEAPEEALPSPGSEESGSVGGDVMQDLIDAIGDLNQTIADAAAGETEQLPAESVGGGTGGFAAELPAAGSADVDLTPVVRVLERTNELLVQQTEILDTQHNDLLQLQANVNFVFLAVCMLAGVVIGCAVGRVFHDLWRA